MAHKRKDTYTPPPEWWQHLRPFNKRRVAKKERQAVKKLISDTDEIKRSNKHAVAESGAKYKSKPDSAMNS